MSISSAKLDSANIEIAHESGAEYRVASMGNKRSVNLFLLICSVTLTAWWRIPNALTVHSWVDRAGVTHFSDVSPGSDVPLSREIHLDDNPPRSPDASLGNDYYSIAKQWERVRAERDASNAAQLQRELMKAQLSPAPTAYSPPDPDAYVDVYSGFRSPYGIFSRVHYPQYRNRFRSPAGSISRFHRGVTALESKMALASPRWARLGGIVRQHRG